MGGEQSQGSDGPTRGCATDLRLCAVPAQAGDRHDTAKVLKGFGSAGVLEVVENDAGGTYRAVYTVRFEEAVFVLHCFQKKSKHGITTPKEDMDIIRARLKVAERLAKELRDEEANRKRD